VNAETMLFILPPQAWDYLEKIQPSERGEIEMQSAINLMIQDGFSASGVLQPIPAEWTPDKGG